jgi:hypothetical protein
MPYIISSVEEILHEGAQEKIKLQSRPKILLERPWNKIKNTIRSRFSPRSFYTASSTDPSTVNCSTTGEKATWGGVVGANCMGAKRPSYQLQGMKEDHLTPPLRQPQGWTSCPTTIEVGKNKSSKKCVEEELYKNWNDRPLAGVNDELAIEIPLLQDILPAPPHLKPADPQHRKLKSFHPSPPRSTGKRNEASIYNI